MLVRQKIGSLPFTINLLHVEILFIYFRSGQVFVVANYDPPGNFIGSFTENVPPIGGFVTAPKIVINNVPDFDDSTYSNTTTTTNSPSLDLDNFVNAMLKYHNEFRRKHSVPDLK